MSMNKRSPKDYSNDGEVSSTSCTQPTALATRFYRSKKVAENGIKLLVIPTRKKITPTSHKNRNKNCVKGSHSIYE